VSALAYSVNPCRPVKYTREVLEKAVAESESIAGVLRTLGLVQAGGTHVHISRSIKKRGIDTSHFTGQSWGRGRKRGPRVPNVERLVRMPTGSPRNKPYVLRRALVATGRPHACAICGNTGTWMCRPLVLHVDHKNGDYLDNRAASALPVPKLPRTDTHVRGTQPPSPPLHAVRTAGTDAAGATSGLTTRGRSVPPYDDPCGAVAQLAGGTALRMLTV
jgi:hypothetical protein